MLQALLLCAALAQDPAAAPLPSWSSDLPRALAQAQERLRPLLFVFR